MTPESGRAGVPPGAGLGVPAHGSTAADGRSSSRAPRACPSSLMASVCLGSRLGSGAGGGGEAGSEEKRERWPGAPGTGDHHTSPGRGDRLGGERGCADLAWFSGACSGLDSHTLTPWAIQVGRRRAAGAGVVGRGDGSQGGPWRSPGLTPCDRPECRVARHQSVRFALRTSEQLLGSVFRQRHLDVGPRSDLHCHCS